MEDIAQPQCVLGIPVYTADDPSSGLSFAFHLDHPRLSIWKLKSSFKNKSWPISPLSVALQFTDCAHEVPCENTRDQEVLMSNRSEPALKNLGARGLLRWSEDWQVETLQNNYFCPSCNYVFSLRFNFGLKPNENLYESLNPNHKSSRPLWPSWLDAPGKQDADSPSHKRMDFFQAVYIYTILRVCVMPAF